MRNRLVITGVFCALCLVALAGAWMRGQGVAAENLVVIVVDTQRVDAMSLYGSERPTTPRLDAWGRDAVVYDNAWAQGAYTLASYVSYMTSTHVRAHGLDGNMPTGGMCGWDDLQMLPEVLREHGFETTAFVSNNHLHPRKGFTRGFDSWNGFDEATLLGEIPKRSLDMDDAQVIDASIEAMRSWEGGGHFLYAHILGPHLALMPSDEAREAVGVPPDAPRKFRGKERHLYTEADRDMIRRMYEADTWDADRGVGRLLDALGSRIDEDTVVVLLSDHGEQLWEHGEYGHRDAVWEQLVHIPLILDGPGIEGRREEAPVELVDVAPTVVELLGIDEIPESWVGQNLLEPQPDRVIFTQRFNEMSLLSPTDAGLRKVVWSWEDEPKREAERDYWATPRRRQWTRTKQERQGRLSGWAVYDIARDPMETTPLADPDLERFRGEYEAWLGQTPAIIRQPSEPVGACTWVGKNEEGDMKQALEVLGYTD